MLSLILAQVTPDPNALMQFLIIVGFLASIITSVLALRGSNRAQKREVSFTNEYATRAEHAELKTRVNERATRAEHAELKLRVDGIDSAVRLGFERLDTKRSHSIAGLHDDLELKTSALRLEVKSDIKGVHDRVTEMLGTVKRIEGKMEK